MSKTNHKVDIYLTAGCGRCPLGNTPQCKVNNWQAELAALRSILLDCGLDEELKWGVPVYTSQKKNIVLIGAFKENCVISFFKGALLKDEHKILSKPGANTQAGRVIRFTDARTIIEMKTVLKNYIDEAVEVEKIGLELKPKDVSEYQIPAELQKEFDENDKFKDAFHSLTPGRQKGYILYFSQPKQPKTREARIERCQPRIMLGKGLND